MAVITDYEQQQIDQANASGREPVVFVHGLWLLPSSWDRWRKVFDDAGYTIYDDLVHMANGGVYAPYVRTGATMHDTMPAFTYRENMLVVIQPNIVTPDMRMGIQVGEMVRVTRTGAERMHRPALDFHVC